VLLLADLGTLVEPVDQPAPRYFGFFVPVFVR